MAKVSLSTSELKRIAEAVKHFEANKHLFVTFAESMVSYLRNSTALAPHIHFLRFRVKEHEHLTQKLKRLALARKQRGLNPDISAANLFEKVHDLAGIRLIHLHTDQMPEINAQIRQVIDEQKLTLVDGPVANCWDVEYEALFKSLGMRPESRDSMYTSVHYDIRANTKTNIHCELQVRTLMEEVWGEVSHRVSYPQESTSRSCREQLKVLARFTSGCTRLVDSIFRDHAATALGPRSARARAAKPAS